MKSKTVDLQILIEESPRVVFDALTDPHEVMLWWRSPDFYRVTGFRLEPRNGGLWYMNAMSHDGKPFHVQGTVLEYDPPSTLAFTWKPDWQDLSDTSVRITLHAVSGGTRLRLVHSGFASDRSGYESHHFGWLAALNWFANYLAGKQNRLRSGK